MQVNFEELDFDEDFLSERAEELGLFQLKLDLPKGLQVIGFAHDNRVLIRHEEKVSFPKSEKEEHLDLIIKGRCRKCGVLLITEDGEDSICVECDTKLEQDEPESMMLDGSKLADEMEKAKSETDEQKIGKEINKDYAKDGLSEGGK